MRSNEERFTSHVADQRQRDTMEEIRNQCRATADFIKANVPEPEASRAIEKLEATMFIANAGVSRGHPAVCQAHTDVDGQIVKCQLDKGHGPARPHYCDGLSW